MKKKLIISTLLVLSLFIINLQKINAEIDPEAICNENKRNDYEKACIYSGANIINEEIYAILYLKNDNTLFHSSGGFEVDYKNPRTQHEDLNPYQVKIANYIEPTNTCPLMVRFSTIQDDSPESAGTLARIVYTQGDALALTGLYGTDVRTNYFHKGTYDSKTCEKTGDENISDIGSPTDITCDSLLDEDIKKIINKLLSYVRIIVPILVLVLGIMDFAMAVFSSKEEDMKKAQSRFAKRLIIALIIFLVPTILKLILDVADSAWKNGLFGQSKCGI